MHHNRLDKIYTLYNKKYDFFIKKLDKFLKRLQLTKRQNQDLLIYIFKSSLDHLKDSETGLKETLKYMIIKLKNI